MEDVVVIIPAYKPDSKLLETIKKILQMGSMNVVVVDDGSGKEYANIFQKVIENTRCTLLRHKQNRGKGVALKTAKEYVINSCPNCIGVVTADADGQHLAEDIYTTARKMKEKEKIVLGVRDFSGSDVPLRSKAGNRITIGVFRLFFGMKISDTQTGLRAFPRDVIPDLLQVEGERYEFETQMLIMMSKKKLSFEEVGISTVYHEENDSSHFRVVRDSVRIYALILKYLFSSISSAVIDEGAFLLFKSIFLSLGLTFFIPSTFIAAFFARVSSSIFNYTANAKVVFKGKTCRKTLIRYYILAVCQIAISASLVFLMENIFTIVSPGMSTAVKTIVDVILFFFSFRIQHKWVFNK